MGANLTLAERILSHLRTYPTEEDAADVPREITQEGIAEALGARVAHVSRALKTLAAQGAVRAHLAHPVGGHRRARAHTLTERGEALARDLPPPERAPPRPAVAAPAPPEARVPAGRGHEMNALVAALDEATHHGPLFALVEGDAGAGKTRLLRAFAAEAERRGARVLRSPAAPTGEEQLIGPIGPALAPLAFDRRFRARTAGTPRERALAAAVEALAAASRTDTVVLELDDLQYAGATVADFLHGLVRALPPGTRVLVVVAIRREEEWALPNGPLYTALMPLRDMPGAIHVDLSPLDRAGVAALLDDAGIHVMGEKKLSVDLVERVWRESGGNALYALSIGQELADGVEETDFFPDAVRTSVTERFSSLSERALGVVQLAAVAGAEFPYETLRRAYEGPEDDLVPTLDLLIDRLFLEEVPGAADDLHLRFRHPKVRDALLHSLTATRRRWLEGRVANAHGAKGS